MFRSKSKKSPKKSSVTKVSIKDKLASQRQKREQRKKLIALLCICLAFSVAIAIPVGFLSSFKVALVVATVIPAIVLSYCYPRTSLWFFLIYMPFSGTITYWVGGGNALFQLSKDAFYFPALIALWQECRRKRKPILIPPKILPSLAIIVICALLTLFLVNGSQQTLLPFCDQLSDKFLRAADGSYLLDPNSGSVLKAPCKDGSPFMQGIVGFKVLLGYFPLIFCANYLIEDKKKLITLMRLFVVLAIVCCSLGLVQYWFLTTGRCEGTRNAVGSDLFKTSIDAKCFIGGALLYSPSQGVIRLPGTFVSPWHWAWFLIANSFITFTAAFNDTSFFWRTGALAGMALVFMNAVICGQRIALALVPTIAIVLLILTGQIANLKRFIPVAIGLSLILSLVAISHPEIIQQRVDSFVNRWNNAPPYEFIQKQFQYAIDQQRGVLGRGIGKATSSTRAFGTVALVETFHPKLLYEIGYFGLTAFMIFMTHLNVLAWQSYRSIKDRGLRSFGAAFWVFMLIISYFPYWYPLDTDPVSVYYWLFAGIIFKLPTLNKQEQIKLKADNSSRISSTQKTRSRQLNRRLSTS